MCLKNEKHFVLFVSTLFAISIRNKIIERVFEIKKYEHIFLKSSTVVLHIQENHHIPLYPYPWYAEDLLVSVLQNGFRVSTLTNTQQVGFDWCLAPKPYCVGLPGQAQSTPGRVKPEEITTQTHLWYQIILQFQQFLKDAFVTLAECFTLTDFSCMVFTYIHWSSIFLLQKDYRCTLIDSGS